MIVVNLKRHNTPASSKTYIGLDELLKKRFDEYREDNKCIPLVNRVRNINSFEIGGYEAILHPDKDAIVGKILNITDTHFVVGIDENYKNLADEIDKYEAWCQCILQSVGSSNIVLMLGQVMIRRR